MRTFGVKMLWTWIKTFGVYTVKMREIEIQEKIRIKKIDKKDNLKNYNCKWKNCNAVKNERT